ncbi:MAG TPA: DUF2520 domain-containing protein [Gammaproteobacteria bacterium]|nr:DUF2520 domain-containing protein [Gammaproteobacteria bacterium]
MRQVPHYLLIGNGCVAKHFQHYFSFLQLSFTTWHRQQSLIELTQHINRATHILLLISDAAIDDFFVQYIFSSNKICIHFSGSLVSRYVYGTHPLMTFSTKLYQPELYQSIPFIIDHNALEFEDLLPGISNQHVRLHTSLKAKYHALCVLSGNFSCVLWKKLFDGLTNEFNISHSLAYPYLLQQMKNLIDDPSSAMTGPLVRGDLQTIKNNLTALQADPFYSVYKSFVACYQQIKETS